MTSHMTRKWMVIAGAGTLVIVLFLTLPNSDNQDTQQSRPVARDPVSRLKAFGKSWSKQNGGGDGEEYGADDQRIIAKEQYKWKWDFPGFCFDERGRTSEITTSVTSSMIHNFSPYVEREAAKRFVDPPHSNVYYANSPAIRWRNGK